jgi:hypothetical protein
MLLTVLSRHAVGCSIPIIGNWEHEPTVRSNSSSQPPGNDMTLFNRLRLVDDETIEIYRHAVTGGVIAVVLTIFHTWAENWVQRPAWRLLVLGALAFAAAVGGIIALGSLLRKWQHNARIALQDSGEFVDGKWLEVIIENGRIARGSILEIGSARGEGFTVNGTSYKVTNGNRLERVATGRFGGRHGSRYPGNGISYPFDGRQEGMDHVGVGYCQFHGAAAEMTFTGAFLVRQGTLISHVIGRKLNDDLSPKDALALLQAFIDDESVSQFVAIRTSVDRVHES